MSRERRHTRRKKYWASYLALSSCVCAFPVTGNAAPVFDPTSEQIRQQELLREQRLRQEPAVDIRLTAEATTSPERLPLDETPCYVIKHVAIAQVSPAGSEQLVWLAEHLSGPADDDTPIGKCLATRGIALIVKRAQDALAAQGFASSRVSVDPQDLSRGTLILTVAPGRIPSVRVARTQATEPWLSLWNTVAARSGETLELRDVEQTLENLKRVPTAQADISIEPADTPDQSDLVISHSQSFPVRLAVSVDDSGTKAIGRYQGSANLSLDNPLSLSDLFYVTVNNDLGGGDAGSRGTRGHVVHYSLPLGYWSLGATVSASRYYLNVAGGTQSYIYRGTSETAELSLARIVQRDKAGKTTLTLKAFQRRSNNYIDDTEVLNQRRVVGGYELALGHRRTLQPAAGAEPTRVQANLSWRRGTGDYDTLPAPEELSGEGTSRFGVLLLDAGLDVPFKAADKSWRYSSTLRVQNNTTPLTPQDRFAIGSRYSVRGFDGETLLSAERGGSLRNELILSLPQSQQLYLGLDYGEVSGPSSDNLVGKALAGAAIGRRGGWGKLQYDFFISTPLHKPSGFKTAATTGGFQASLNF